MLGISTRTEILPVCLKVDTWSPLTVISLCVRSSPSARGSTAIFFSAVMVAFFLTPRKNDISSCLAYLT